MRFGIIGTNYISDRFLAALPFTRATASAVYSRKKETGEAFAEKHGIPLVFTSLEAFLTSDAFDAVYVASPNFLHKEHSIAALKAGKHVLCEKPIAPSLREFLEMKAAADQAGLALVEAMRPTFDSTWASIRERLPLIGKIRSVHLDYCQYSGRYDAFLAGTVLNAFNPALSNAALLDIGVYPVSVAARLFGMPRAVKSQSLFLSNGFEGGGSVLLSYDGFAAHISYSKVCDSATPSVIIGEGGSITVDRVSEPKEVFLTLRGESSTPIPWVKHGAPDNMFEEINAFCAFARARDTENTSEISRITLSVMDAVRKENGIRFPSDEI